TFRHLCFAPPFVPSDFPKSRALLQGFVMVKLLGCFDRSDLLKADAILGKMRFNPLRRMNSGRRSLTEITNGLKGKECCLTGSSFSARKTILLKSMRLSITFRFES